GAEGRTIAWSSRRADATTGRVVIDDFKGGVGDRGGFGYDANGSPDLCGFGYAEVTSDRDRPALLLFGSSGSMNVTVNEETVYTYRNFAGRPYSPDADLVRCNLKKGINRILVQTRQGIASWSFSVQVSDASTSVSLAAGAQTVDLEALRAFAMK